MKTDMKQTQENNGKGCSKKECLEIEIFEHFKKVYSYVVWNKKHVLGEIVEDNIIQLLTKNQLVDFYYSGKNKFKVERWKVETYLSKNDK